MTLSPEDPGPGGPTADLTAPVAFGKYVLLRRLAVGGSSDIFLARPLAGEDPAPLLVIKRLLPSRLADQTNFGLFAQEARLHRLVQHPNVVRVFEAGEVQGEPYLAMQLVDGIDAHRLLRRLHREGLTLPWPVASYIARALAVALAAVHDTADEQGSSLRIVHRDVTPSNVYLSRSGDVLLGDFGIARKMTARTSRPDENPAIKGKLGYLAPEQVNAEPADHRADLFSLAVCTTELLLGGPLFPGDAEFAVLLAIRDGRIDNLDELNGKVPEGLITVLRRALARRPEDRFYSAGDVAEALRPFCPDDPNESIADVQEWVRWAADTNDIVRRLEDAVREAAPPAGKAGTTGVDRRTRDIGPIAVRLSQGQLTVTFARLIEMIVTGDIDGGTMVNWLGDGFLPVREIEVLERHLPDSLMTQTQNAPGRPDLEAELTPDALLSLLAKLHTYRETGLVLIDGGPDNHRRKEAYFEQGVLQHVGSADGSELLGQSLVRRGVIATDELDLALAMLSRFDGRLGDTLLALGLLDTVQLFQALQEQAKERIVSLFERQGGRAVFYRGVKPTRVEQPLQLGLIPLMLAGMEAAFPGNAPTERHRLSAARIVRRGGRPVDRATMPRAILAVTEAIGHGTMPLRLLAMRLATAGTLPTAEALRALDVALALELLELE